MNGASNGKEATVHLVTFLGTGRYEETDYHLESDPKKEVRTRYVARAIAELLGAGRVTVLATEAAENTHGDGLRQDLGHRKVRFERIPDGKTEAELWAQFRILDQAMREGNGTLLLDITHGFRSQPFFAAGALALQRAAGTFAERTVRVLYGRFLPEAPDRSPIWDLSAMVDLLDWAQAANLFVGGGSARPLAQTFARMDELLRARKKGAIPETYNLATALNEFADDYATLRVRDLLTKRAPALARRLEAYGDAAAKLLPMLSPLLARLQGIAEALAVDRLHGPAGHGALAALARSYVAQERYVEAMAVTREAFVSLHAEGPEATEPGPGFDVDAREAAERAWDDAVKKATGNRHAPGEKNLRNDVLHCGFRTDPMGGTSARKQIEDAVKRLEEAVAKRSSGAPDPAPGRTS